MAVFRIVCVYRVDAGHPLKHAHFMALGTVEAGDPGGDPTATWNAAEVERAIAGGHEFVASNRETTVRLLHWRCPLCGAACLKSEPRDALNQLADCLIE